MTKPITLLLIALLFRVFDARADRFILDGDTVSFWYTSPLRQHPDFSGLLTKLEGFRSLDVCFHCNVQGYDAEWTVIDGYLYLTNIYSEYGAKENLKADINKLFNATDGKIKATWVTDKLWIPVGKGVGYVDMETILYAAEKLVIIVDGHVISIKRFDYPGNKAAANHKRLDSIPAYLLSNVKWNKVRGMLKSGQKAKVGFTTSPTGKPVDITFYGTSPDKRSKKEIIRLISSMPFPGPFIRGQFWPSAFILPVKFTNDDRKKYEH